MQAAAELKITASRFRTCLSWACVHCVDDINIDKHRIALQSKHGLVELWYCISFRRTSNLVGVAFAEVDCQPPCMSVVRAE